MKTIPLGNYLPLAGFIAALFFPIGSASAAPGATLPWTTYEAENMATNGAILGPGYAPNTVEAESSGRKCVQLSSTGQYVELTAQAAANSIVVRYSVPDTSGGGGSDYTISLYKNGAFLQKLTVTSKYSWLYGAYPFSNTPGSSPRNFYDEVRLLGLTINSGDKIRIQKDSLDSAAYYIIDLIDLEQVAGALAQPANSLNITASPYNAVGNGSSDCTTPLQNCVNDAISQGKIVWVPPGSYVITGDINNLQSVTIQGAGMWYTNFVGNPAVYGTSTSRVRFNGNGNNAHFADFAIIGKLNYRNDSEANDAFSGNFGSGSSIERVWVEHTKTGAWIANATGMTIDSCRMRNTVADGINLSVGVRSTTVSNCTTRGTGDDCFAMWPATYEAQTYAPGLNTFSHCTGELAFLANGGALYGGESNTIADCLFIDMTYGCGVLVSGTFPVGANTFTGTTTIERSTLLRCGGYDPGYQWRAALQFTMENNPISNVSMNNLQILDSASDGLSVIAGNTLSNASVSILEIGNFGLGVSGSHGLWARSDANGSLSVSNANSTNVESDSANFQFNFVRLPAKYEAEDLVVQSSSAGIVPRVVSESSYSAGEAVIYDGTAVGQQVTFVVPNVSAGTYNVSIGVKKFTGRGDWQLAIGPAGGGFTNLGSAQDEYSASPDFTSINLGAWTPASTGDKWFRFTITGKDASSIGYSESFDYISLTPQ